MSDRAVDLLLEDILNALGRIDKYLENQNKQSFLDNPLIQDAVIRNIGVVGEIVRRFPEDFIEQHPELPWFQIRGMRNRLVHDYLGIDLELVWVVTQQDLPKLRKQLENLM